MRDMTRRRRALMMAQKKSRLPSEYQEVEYLESTGTQWIDIPFSNISTTINRYVFNYMHRNPIIMSSTILGNGVLENGDGDYNRIGQLWFRTDGITAMSIGEVVSVASRWRVNTILGRKIEAIVETNNAQKKYSVVYDGRKSEEYSFTGNNRTDRPLKIFASGPTGTQAANIVLYSISIYGDDVLEFDGVPCYRKSDNKPGMYDLVTKTFFTNAGTGEFIVGADVK